MMTPQTQNLLANSISSSRDSEEYEENSMVMELSPRSLQDNDGVVGKRAMQ